MEGVNLPASLEGDLGHFFPTEVLQLLQLSQATGRLELVREGERVDLFLERGRPVFARTSGVAVRAGEVLVHRGHVRADGRRRIGELLIEAGDAHPEQVRDAVHEVLRRIVYGLVLWRDGRFRFVPGEGGIGEDIQIDLDLDRLILEGLRLADQERASRQQSPS